MKTIVMLINMTWYWFIGTLVYKLHIRGAEEIAMGIATSSIISYLLAFIYGRMTSNHRKY